ncbi:MAG: hypothetical protein JWN89_190 [Parcubacteria group bacterium]|nr:hypothetical protein [Parcubacteria group bacterium]
MSSPIGCVLIHPTTPPDTDTMSSIFDKIDIEPAYVEEIDFYRLEPVLAANILNI